MSFGFIWEEGDGHESEFAGLHPRQAATLEAARATLRGIHLDPVHAIGCDSAWDIAPYAFAAWDKTGEKAEALGYTPLAVTLGDRVDLYEVPSPLMVTVASTLSRRACIVLVVFTATNDMGYGDWGTATCGVEGIYDTLDDAEQRFQDIVKAVRTLRGWGRRGGPSGARVGPKGPGF